MTATSIALLAGNLRQSGRRLWSACLGLLAGGAGLLATASWTNAQQPVPATPDKRLLLFVHGLGGSGIDTWTSEGGVGFRELIVDSPHLGRQYDVRFFEFPTSLLPIPLISEPPTIQSLAEALHTQLETRYREYAAVALVGHSLGGLIIRQYLVDRIKGTGSVDRVRKVMLYAVPNNGAELANFAKIVPFRHGQLKQLATDSDFIRALNRDWARLDVGSRIDLKYVVGAQDQVVDEASARHEWGNENVYTVANRGHVDLVKPGSKDDDTFLFLRDFLDEHRESYAYLVRTHDQQRWTNFVDGVARAISDLRQSTTIPFHRDPSASRAALIVLAMPYHVRIEPPEVRFLKRYVNEGGSLLLLGYYAPRHHESNFNDVTREFGVSCNDDVVMPAASKPQDARRHVFSTARQFGVTAVIERAGDHPIVSTGAEAFFISACSLTASFEVAARGAVVGAENISIWKPVYAQTGGDADPYIDYYERDRESAASLLLGYTFGQGRVVVVGTWKIFTTAEIADNAELLKNVISWLKNEN